MRSRGKRQYQKASVLWHRCAEHVIFLPFSASEPFQVTDILVSQYRDWEDGSLGAVARWTVLTQHALGGSSLGAFPRGAETP